MRILITGGSGFIGTTLVDKLALNGHQIRNLDYVAPKINEQLEFWKECNILDADQVDQAFANFRPDAVIHLAAKTDTDPSNSLEDYEVNMRGSQNIISAIQKHKEIKRVIITSTQFVHQYHDLPEHDEDFAPHTVYGQSKVMMEKMIRNANLDCTWTIIRPTNIWGPWHLRYPYEFWKVLSKGLYIHPGRKPVIRSYGYVGNVVFQINSILEAPSEKINQQVFYVGDRSIDLYYWVNGFSLKQTGKKVRVVPRLIVKILAWIGDLLSTLNLKFPITTSRYKSMTNSNTAPMEKTFDAFGTPPYSLDQGIDETIQWMKKYHPNLIRKNEEHGL